MAVELSSFTRLLASSLTAARVGRAKLEAGDFPAFALFASKAFIKTICSSPPAVRTDKPEIIRCKVDAFDQLDMLGFFD